MTYEQAMMYCAQLQSLIDAGLNLSVHIRETLFEVDQIAVIDGVMLIHGYDAKGIQQTLRYQFPVGYISVTVLSDAFVNHV